MPVEPFRLKVFASTLVTVKVPLAAVLPATPDMLMVSPVFRLCPVEVTTMGEALLAPVTATGTLAERKRKKRFCAEGVN